MLFLIATTTLILLMVSYTVPPVYIKKRIVLASVVTSLIYAFIPLLCGAIILQSYNNLYLFFIITVTSIGFITVKDIEDYAGDKVHGIKTIPVTIGVWDTLKVISFLSIVPLIMLLLVSIQTQAIKLSLAAFISILISILFVFYLNQNTHKLLPIRKQIITHTKITRNAILCGCLIELIIANAILWG